MIDCEGPSLTKKVPMIDAMMQAPPIASGNVIICIKASPPARVKKISSSLQKAYPDAHCELNHSNPLELLVATILSAQCTDKRVNVVTAGLFRKYRTAADYARANPIETNESRV